MELIYELIAMPSIQALGVVAGSIIAAWLVELIISKTLAVAASRTATDLDDAIIEILRRPIFLSVVLYGLDWAVELLALPERFAGSVVSILKTLLIIVWGLATIRIGTIVLHSMSAKARERALLQPRTLPVFDILLKTLVVAGTFYFIFLAWNIDLTAWMASAGIVGIAVGFAAKDTLANLFSGIFILADAPYKVKDWIMLDNQLRGEVTHIGVRSTRILTSDGVEINVPNAVIGNAQLLNECGGPHPRQRLRVKFSVAYGSDIDQVRAVVGAAIAGAPEVLDTPAPVVRFREMGDSGLNFEIWLWFDEPRMRDIIVDDILSRIYKAFNAASIEMPFPKRDIYIKEVPAGSFGLGGPSGSARRDH